MGSRRITTKVNRLNRYQQRQHRHLDVQSRFSTSIWGPTVPSGTKGIMGSEMDTFAARLASFDAVLKLEKRRSSSAKGSNVIAWPHQSPSPAEVRRSLSNVFGINMINVECSWRTPAFTTNHTRRTRTTQHAFNAIEPWTAGKRKTTQ